MAAFFIIMARTFNDNSYQTINAIIKSDLS